MYQNCMLDITILDQVILFTRLHYYTECQNRKRDIIQSNIHKISPKVNQTIYTLDTNCMPNIMIIAHAVIQMSFWVKCLSLWGIIQSNIHRILRKVNQVIYMRVWMGFIDLRIMAIFYTDYRIINKNVTD